MSLGSFFKGTSIDQNSKFTDKDKKIINNTKWPEVFEQKVDISKVNLESLKDWMDQRITELMQMEDELVTNLAVSYLEEKQEDNKAICPKRITVNLTGFMGDNAVIFMEELWKILLEAQDSKFGIPSLVIDLKKEERNVKEQIIKEKQALLAKIKAKERENQHLAEEQKVLRGSERHTGNNRDDEFTHRNDRDRRVDKPSKYRSDRHRHRDGSRKRDRHDRHRHKHRRRRGSPSRSSSRSRDDKKRSKRRHKHHKRHHKSRHDDSRRHKRRKHRESEELRESDHASAESNGSPERDNREALNEIKQMHENELAKNHGLREQALKSISKPE